MSQLTLKASRLIRSSRLVSSSNDISRRSQLLTNHFQQPNFILLKQVRCAGHAKWQNIAKTKFATDQLKAKTISRYVLMVRRAIVSNGMQTNPKLNGKLNDVLNEASRMNVPKATLERAIVRAANVKTHMVTLEIQGPVGSAVIVRCETESPSVLRRDMKKILKKFDANLMPEDSLISMFQSRGFIRAAVTTKDGRDIDEDFAEEAAIIANAEDYSFEFNDDTADETLSKAWVFQTNADGLNPCKGELEKLGLRILSCDLDLVPYRKINFGEEAFAKILEMAKLMREHEQVLDVFHNAEVPISEAD